MKGNHEIGDWDAVWKAITTREDDGRRMEGKHKGG